MADDKKTATAPATETAPTTPETPATPAVAASAVMTLRGVVALSGAGGPQAGYNLNVDKTHAESIAALEALAAHPKLAGTVDVENANGEVYISVKAGAKAKAAIKKAGAFDVLIEATVRITGARNRQMRGEIVEVKTAAPADILNGGRVVEPSEEAIERRQEARAMAQASGGARRGGLGSFRI